MFGKFLCTFCATLFLSGFHCADDSYKASMVNRVSYLLSTLRSAYWLCLSFIKNSPALNCPSTFVWAKNEATIV